MTDSNTHPILRLAALGVVFIVLLSGFEWPLSNEIPGTQFDQESFDKLAAWLSPQIRAEQADSRLSQSHFSEALVSNWQRSVVAIGQHEPLVGETSWHRYRTGFAVSGGAERLGGQRIVSANVSSTSWVGDKIRLHSHPFHMPQTWYAHGGSAIREGRLSVFLARGATIAAPVALADLATAEYENRFPVVLIGFDDDQPTRFYTHSVGVGDHAAEIKLAQRPLGVFGEFFGAPVFNTRGQVVGVYAPTDNKPTYVTSKVICESLYRR